MPASDAPLPQLTELVGDLSEKYLRNIHRLAQRGAWLEYRDSKVYPGAAFRFTHAAKPIMGFSYRTRRWVKRKNGTPDYVQTGSFRDQVLARAPKSRQSAGEVATKFSIFGGVLNTMVNRFGRKNAQEGKGLIQRNAYTRRGRNGATVSVRAYKQRGFTRGALSSQSEAEEWGYRPGEIISVQHRTDQLGAMLWRATAFDKKGRLRTNPRVTKANLRQLIGAD